MKNKAKVFINGKMFLASFLITSLMIASSSSFTISANAETATNVAAGKSATSSGDIAGGAALVTDGDKNSNDFAGVTQNLQWI